MNEQHSMERQAARLSLIAIFLGSFAIFSSRLGGKEKVFFLRPFDLVLLALATYRTGRLISYDRVAKPIREPFTETKQDDSGAGETVVAEGEGTRFVLGELISCPTCVGTWAAAALVYGLRFFPLPTRVYLWIMGTVGLAELLSWLLETLTWTAQEARKNSATEDQAN